MQANPETGFLESPGYAGATFDAARKVQFINLAEKHFKTTGAMPDLVSVAEVVGVHPRTVENHLKDDEAFAEAWRNVRLKGKWRLESKMYEYGLTKSGYMDRITWLRTEFPEEYNPDVRVVSSTDFSWVKALVNALKSPVVDAQDAIISTPKAIDEPQSFKE